MLTASEVDDFFGISNWLTWYYVYYYAVFHHNTYYFSAKKIIYWFIINCYVIEKFTSFWISFIFIYSFNFDVVCVRTYMYNGYICSLINN